MAGGLEDVELAFVALLRGAGLDARLLRVPERSWMFFDVNMMDESFVRSLDVAVLLHGRWRGFDVAAPYLPWDMLVADEESQPAVFCDPDSGGFITLDSSEPERSASRHTATLTLMPDGTLDGDVHATFSGHANEDLRAALEDAHGDDADTAFVDALGWDRHSVQISRVRVDRGARDWDPLQVDYHVVMPEHATVTSKRILLQPAAMHAHEPARFTAGKRRWPVYFKHSWAESDTIRIRLPAGWRVEELDQPQPVEAKGVAAYRASILQSDDGAQLLYLRALVAGEDGTTLFPADSYPALKRLFDLIHDGDQATVTLVRGDTR
jgi:hypothetical protein